MWECVYFSWMNTEKKRKFESPLLFVSKNYKAIQGQGQSLNYNCTLDTIYEP